MKHRTVSTFILHTNNNNNTAVVLRSRGTSGCNEHAIYLSVLKYLIVEDKRVKRQFSSHRMIWAHKICNRKKPHCMNETLIINDLRIIYKIQTPSSFSF
jgi:hypothetical protein